MKAIELKRICNYATKDNSQGITTRRNEPYRFAHMTIAKATPGGTGLSHVG